MDLIVRDHVRRMYREAHQRLHDADILSQSLITQSDSQALIRILAFEVLLKCALLVCGQRAKRNHNYQTFWKGLPGYVQKEVLEAASDRMPRITDFSQLDKLLISYQHVFEKARYYYECYEGYTLEEQSELGNYWLDIGESNEEAEVQYFPLELECLIFGLSVFIEKSL